MRYKNKNGYISIEYIIVASLVIVACSVIFVQNMPSYAGQVNAKTQSVIDIVSSDETVVNE